MFETLCPNRCEPSIETLNFGGGGGGGSGGQGRCERRSVFFGGGWGVGGEGQGRCERRSEVFVKIQKKKFWGRGRVGVSGCM